MAIKKTFRVKRNQDFDAIFRAKKSSANRAFVVYRRDCELPHFRLGLSVSKKLGNAVVRNHIKRLIRHAVRELSGNLVATDFVVIARAGVEKMNFMDVKKNLLHVLKLSKIYQNRKELD